MPFEMTFPDSIYKPQFDVTASVTVHQPYREEKCIYVRGRWTKDPTTGLYPGYAYYNVSKMEVRICDGTSFSIKIPAETRDKGVIYYAESVSAFCEFDGMNLVTMDLDNPWNHVYIRTTSVTVEPTTHEVGDWYYNASTHLLYFWNNYTWREFGAPWTGQIWYAFNNELYYYYNSSSPSMHRCYGMVQFGIVMESTWVIRQFTSDTVTFDYTFAYPGNDIARTFDMRCIWKDDFGNPQYMPEDGVAYEDSVSPKIQGRGGTINASLTWLTPLQEYCTTDFEYQAQFLCSPTSEKTASVLAYKDTTGLLMSEYFGVKWFLAKTGGDGGIFAELPLADVVKLGYATLTTTNSGSDYNLSRQSFRLKYSGQYTLKAKYNYTDAAKAPWNGWRSRTWKVYSPASPKLEISSNPSPSPDPEIYPPPYTVVLHDASATSNPYQIPMKTITLDAGDSADPESWTLENAAPWPLITIPDKTHIYNGYGPYRPSITIVDMNNDTSVGYAQFAPNKDARIYANPKITYKGTDYAPGSAITGGEAPILLECHAYVAGSPLPEVKWSYALNPSSEYYTGEKIGEFAELSLLAGGSYNITCKITSGNTVLGEYAWTVSATSVVVADTPVALQDFVIWIYDANGERIDRIVPTSAQYVDRFAHASYCEFALPMDYKFMNCLTPGCELAFGYLGKARLMIVTGFAEDDAGEFVTITAKDAASVALESRVATIATRSTSGNGYDVQTCSAEALLRYFAVANAREGNRAIARMKVVDACQDRGGRTTYSTRYETVLSIFEDICTDSGLGWDSSLQTTSGTFFSMKVVAGIDHTYNTSPTSIIFEDRKNGRGSATLGSFSGFLPSNLAIAAGKGNGSSREYKEFGSVAATGLDRREVFVDAGESADELEMEREAEAELKKQDEKSIMVYPNQDVYKLGVDYHVGDYVTVISKSGIMLHLQIIQANYSLDETGKTLSLECGSDLRDYQKLLRETKLANAYSRK